MSETSNTPLISLNPSSLLVFNLEKDVQSKAILQITNTSSSKVVFKVKTTQPTWYYVRPNQQILDVGQTEDVIIQLVESESNKYIDDLASNTHERADKHRFLVQSKVLEDDQFIRLKQLESSQRVDEMGKLWDSGDKDARRNNKLRVEFKVNPNKATDNQGSTEKSQSRDRDTTGDGSSRNERQNIIDKLVRKSNNVDHDGGNKDSNEYTQDAMLNDLKNLRKKYDTLVEYTVHLTAERDSIYGQLEDLKTELSRERSKKKSDGNNSPADSILTGKDAMKKAEEKGFTLLALILSALLAFFLGRYLS